MISTNRFTLTPDYEETLAVQIPSGIMSIDMITYMNGLPMGATDGSNFRYGVIMASTTNPKEIEEILQNLKFPEYKPPVKGIGVAPSKGNAISVSKVINPCDDFSLIPSISITYPSLDIIPPCSFYCILPFEKRFNSITHVEINNKAYNVPLLLTDAIMFSFPFDIYKSGINIGYFEINGVVINVQTSKPILGKDTHEPKYTIFSLEYLPLLVDLSRVFNLPLFSLTKYGCIIYDYRGNMMSIGIVSTDVL